MNEKELQENFEKFQQEMRRGLIALAAMSQLQAEQYGYSLINDLNEKGYEIGQDTLYPLLRRLEKQGLLDSEWRVDDPRPRRYYVLNQNGKTMFGKLKAEWKSQEDILRRLIDETE